MEYTVSERKQLIASLNGLVRRYSFIVDHLAKPETRARNINAEISWLKRTGKRIEDLSDGLPEEIDINEKLGLPGTD
ncbi:hypothetical protein ACAH71_004607 [Escherichia coli]